MTGLLEVLKRHPGPAQVMLDIQFPGESSVRIECDDTIKVLPDAPFFAALKPWAGPKDVRIVAHNRVSLKSNGRNDRRDWGRPREKPS